MPKPTVPPVLPTPPMINGLALIDRSGQDFVLEQGIKQAALQEQARLDAIDARMAALAREYQGLLSQQEALSTTRARELGESARTDNKLSLDVAKANADDQNMAYRQALEQTQLNRRQNLSQQGSTYRGATFGGGGGSRLRPEDIPDQVSTWVKQGASTVIGLAQADDPKAVEKGLRGALQAMQGDAVMAGNGNTQLLVAGIVQEVASRATASAGIPMSEAVGTMLGEIEDPGLRDAVLQGLALMEGQVRPRLSPEDAARAAANAPQMRSGVAPAQVERLGAPDPVNRSHIFGTLDNQLDAIDARSDAIRAELELLGIERAQMGDILRTGQQTAREQMGGRKPPEQGKVDISKLAPQDARKARLVQAAVQGRKLVEVYASRTAEGKQEWAKVTRDPIYTQVADMMRLANPRSEPSLIRDQLRQRYDGDPDKQARAMAYFMALSAIKKFGLGEID